jgi:hypothetical protein
MENLMVLMYVLYKNIWRSIWVLSTILLIYLSFTVDTKIETTSDVVGKAYINEDLYGYITGDKGNGFKILPKEGTTLNGNKLTHQAYGVVFLLSSIFGWTSLLFFLIFFALSWGDDVWDYDDIKSEYLVKTIKSYYEGGEYIYIFRGRLIHKSTNVASARSLSQMINKYFELKELFPVYTPVEVKRDKKLKKILG